MKRTKGEGRSPDGWMDIAAVTILVLLVIAFFVWAFMTNWVNTVIGLACLLGFCAIAWICVRADESSPGWFK